MSSQRESLPAVTAAGIVAIVFACFGILSFGFFTIAIWALPNLPSSQTTHPPFPPEMRAMVSVIYGVFFAIAVGELVVGINVLRRKNWARITILAWAALMAFFCAIAFIGVFFVLSVMPQSLPNTSEMPGFLVILKVFLLVFYGIPFAVGIWWLILFTRPRVAAAFQQPTAFAQAPLALDASGFPMPVVPVADSPRKPSIPLPIALIAAFDLLGAAWMILALFLPLPFKPPFFFFGFEVHWISYKVFFAVLGTAYAVFIAGIFKLKPWALDSLIVFKSLLFLSGIVTLLNPRFLVSMDAAMAAAQSANPFLPNGSPTLPHGFFSLMMWFSFLFGMALVGIMLFYRPRFLEAAARQ